MELLQCYGNIALHQHVLHRRVTTRQLQLRRRPKHLQKRFLLSLLIFFESNGGFCGIKLHVCLFLGCGYAISKEIGYWLAILGKATFLFLVVEVFQVSISFMR